MNDINQKGLLTAFIALLILACNNFTVNNQTTKNKKNISPTWIFDLSQPDKKIKLPFELQEISGLSYFAVNQLICIQDEKADVYDVDYKIDSINTKFKSNIFGDYEGIEYVNGSIWLIKSNGELLEIEDNEIKNIYKLDKVSAKNDVEGLGYDSKTNSLLIAFKAKPHLKKEKKLEDTRAVYLFNLKSKKLQKKPFLTIDLKELNKKYELTNFMPSGIARHPINDEFYIISAVNKGFIVLSRKSKIIYAEKLSKSIFRQPEGICFSPDGDTLFISNEGRNKKGNILIFNKRKQNGK